MSIRFTDFNIRKIYRSRFGDMGSQLVSISVLLLLAASSFAQASPQSQAPQAAICVEGAAPLTITLHDALQRVRKNDP